MTFRQMAFTRETPPNLSARWMIILERMKAVARESVLFDKSYTFYGGVTEEKKREMKELLKDRIGFIV